MRRAYFALRIPNPLYWLNLRARWRSIVFRAAIQHIEAVNERAKRQILMDDYAHPEPVVSVDPLMHGSRLVRRVNQEVSS